MSAQTNKVHPDESATAEDTLFRKWASTQHDLVSVVEVEGCYCFSTKMGLCPFCCLAYAPSCIAKGRSDDELRMYEPFIITSLVLPLPGPSVCAYCCNSEDEPITLDVRLEKGSGQELGLLFDTTDALTIISIQPGCLVDAWNLNNFEKVEVGHRITEVNGIRDKQTEMLEEMKKSSTVQLKVEGTNSTRQCYRVFARSKQGQFTTPSAAKIQGHNGRVFIPKEFPSARRRTPNVGLRFYRTCFGIVSNESSGDAIETGACLLCPRHSFSVREEGRQKVLKSYFREYCVCSDDHTENAPAQNSMLRDA